MALPTGLLPVLVFVLTVGVSTLVALGAHLGHRAGDPFASALEDALRAVGALYLVGVAGVWAAAGGGSLWGVAAALLLAGVAALLAFVLLPLAVGQWLVRRARGVDSESALRLTTAGWPVAMLVTFGVFVAPGGLAGGHLLHLGGPRACLVGFCGVAVSLVAAVVLEAVVAVVGPGVVGLAIHAAATRSRGRS
jgi:hypothetical protein